MNETNETIQPTETATRPAWSKRLLIGGLAVASLAGIGAFAATAGDFGGERMHRGGMGPQHGMEMRAGPASWRGGHGFGIDRVLDAIDATDEQQDRIEDIFDGVQDEVRPLMRQFRDTREDLAELLGAATIDPAAVEALRAERIAAIDAASKTVTAALLEAAEVLTPEQRAELVERFEDRRGFRRW